jgi:hypothetical protein
MESLKVIAANQLSNQKRETSKLNIPNSQYNTKIDPTHSSY